MNLLTSQCHTSRVCSISRTTVALGVHSATAQQQCYECLPTENALTTCNGSKRARQFAAVDIRTHLAFVESHSSLTTTGNDHQSFSICFLTQMFHTSSPRVSRFFVAERLQLYLQHANTAPTNCTKPPRHTHAVACSTTCNRISCCRGRTTESAWAAPPLLTYPPPSPPFTTPSLPV